jgi:uncharacterized protein YecA (UPF0149 family)
MDGTGPDALQQLLDELPATAEPLDVVMLDGYLCALLLREQAPAPEEWLPFVLDSSHRSAECAASCAGPSAAGGAEQSVASTWFGPDL